MAEYTTGSFGNPGSSINSEPQITAELVQICLARAEHLQSIVEIERRSAQLFSDEDLPLALKHSVTDAEILQDALAHERLWVALNKTGESVGFALAGVVDGQAHLHEIGVLPNFGRCGIGTRLVQTVAGWASKEGFSELTLVTFVHLPWNAPFYRQLGFDQLGPDEHRAGLRELIDAEAAAGIDIRKRVGMKLSLGNGMHQSS